MTQKKLLRRRYLLPAGICLLVIFGIVLYYFFYPMSITGKDTYIYIDSDDNVDSVYAKVRPEVTKSSMVGFATLARHLNYQDHLRPGRYLLTPSMGAFSLIRKLRNGNQESLMVTIPSVRTLENLAKKLDRKLEADSAAYMALFNDSAKIAELGYTIETLPAVFIPDTYDFYWTDNPEKLLKRMMKEHDNFWTAERKEQAKAVGLTPLEVSILASIVDSETLNDGEKPMIAKMYLNRLEQGIKLQADPTVIFANHDFTIRRVVLKHLRIDSPYNTYRYEGLPPGPIRVPSKAGIEAVLRPANHDYIFMCANPNFNGTHIFAKTPEEHMKNAKAYQAELNRRNIK